jgi:hypothetical protein
MKTKTKTTQTRAQRKPARKAALTRALRQFNTRHIGNSGPAIASVFSDQELMEAFAAVKAARDRIEPYSGQWQTLSRVVAKLNQGHKAKQLAEPKQK